VVPQNKISQALNLCKRALDAWDGPTYVVLARKQRREDRRKLAYLLQRRLWVINLGSRRLCLLRRRKPMQNLSCLDAVIFVRAARVPRMRFNSFVSPGLSFAPAPPLCAHCNRARTLFDLASLDAAPRPAAPSMR
jgi:hypothetical protein